MPQGWGRTPIIYLEDIDGTGYTSVPERQDPWERGLALMGQDSPDGWQDHAAWEYYNTEVLGWWRKRATIPEKVRTVKHKVPPPDVTTLAKVGIANPPRGLVTRFYVNEKDGKWIVSDMDTGGWPASGTKQNGYTTKEEAVEVAEELAANRDKKYTRMPF